MELSFVGPGCQCGSGAIFNLRSNRFGQTRGLRPTPPDCRFFPDWCYDEAVTAGEIRHAVRFTVNPHNEPISILPPTTPAATQSKRTPMGCGCD
jgi:hypothetical protein